MAYTASGQKLYEEALRVVPGILGAKHRRDPAGAKVLLDGYFETAIEVGLTQKDAWQVLLNASIHWLSRLLERYSDTSEIDITEVIQRMGTVAALWRPSAADPQ